MNEKKPNPFNIIRHRGEPTKATFMGITVTRQEKIYIYNKELNINAFIACAPYDDHFIFEVPQHIKNVSSLICTCGSIAGIPNPWDVRNRMIVCAFHATYGYHTTSVVNKDDFGNKDLSNVNPEKGRKWVI